MASLQNSSMYTIQMLLLSDAISYLSTKEKMCPSQPQALHLPPIEPPPPAPTNIVLITEACHPAHPP